MKPLRTSQQLLNSVFTEDEQKLLKPPKSSAIGMEVVIKFHRNQRGGPQGYQRNQFVSWTLNKLAVIDRAWVAANTYDGRELPVQDREWWRVKIEEETSPGQPLGCFVVRPLWKINDEDIVVLAPSTWDCVQQGITVLLYPKLKPWLNWVIPRALRKSIMKRTSGASLIIPLSYPPEGAPDASTLPESYSKLGGSAPLAHLNDIHFVDIEDLS